MFLKSTATGIVHMISQFYAFSLGSLIVASTFKWARIFIPHLNAVLLAFCGVYAYRDVVPLILINGAPSDKAEGPLLWVKIGVLVLGGIVIPLAIPKRYVPVDPEVSKSWRGLLGVDML